RTKRSAEPFGTDELDTQRERVGPHVAELWPTQKWRTAPRIGGERRTIGGARPTGRPHQGEFEQRRRRLLAEKTMLARDQTSLSDVRAAELETLRTTKMARTNGFGPAARANTQEAWWLESRLLGHSVATIVHFVDDIVRIRTIDRAANGLSCAKNLFNSAGHSLSHRSRPHRLSDVNNLVEERDDQGGSRGHHAGHRLTVLNDQLHRHLQALPFLRSLGNVFADLLWRQAKRPNFWRQRRCGADFASDGAQINNVDSGRIKLAILISVRARRNVSRSCWTPVGSGSPAVLARPTCRRCIRLRQSRRRRYGRDLSSDSKGDKFRACGQRSSGWAKSREASARLSRPCVSVGALPNGDA
uniref:Transposase n=1 Tax=Macrostomum lignano TaxID=282301 RepID=A0A1I8JQE4_9PLAT